jgi:hypothetical protein
MCSKKLSWPVGTHGEISSSRLYFRAEFFRFFFVFSIFLRIVVSHSRNRERKSPQLDAIAPLTSRNIDLAYDVSTIDRNDDTIEGVYPKITIKLNIKNFKI